MYGGCNDVKCQRWLSCKRGEREAKVFYLKECHLGNTEMSSPVVLLGMERGSDACVPRLF